MTESEVAQWFADNGVGDIGRDEAGYVYGKYGPGGESDPTAPGNAAEAALEGWPTIEQILQSSLPSYMQRHLSGGSGPGSYNTNLNDPAITMGGYTAPARWDSNIFGLFPDLSGQYPGGVSLPGGSSPAPRPAASSAPLPPTPYGGGLYPPLAPGQPRYPPPPLTPGPSPGPPPPPIDPNDPNFGPGPGVRRRSTDPTIAALQTASRSPRQGANDDPKA